MSGRRNDLVVRTRSARYLGRCFSCRIGQAGARPDKKEGDGATPAGAFRIEGVLYRPDRMRPPATRLPICPIRRRDGWSDDPGDPAYNTPVRLPHPFRHETLWRFAGIYDLIGILDWNRSPIRPGLGSGIFLHSMNPAGRPTDGCISLALQDLLFVLRHWSRDSRLVAEATR